jgi:hypothetical protein
MNCAHLENCLHEAREEARTNKCAAERRAAEYEALRSSALKIHSLFERLRGCITAPGVPGLADSLRSLSLSLARYGPAFILCTSVSVFVCACERELLLVFFLMSFFFLIFIFGCRWGVIETTFSLVFWSENSLFDHIYIYGF